MKKIECPACDTEVYPHDGSCPICNYEFPEKPKAVTNIVTQLIVLVVVAMIFRFSCF